MAEGRFVLIHMSLVSLIYLSSCTLPLNESSYSISTSSLCLIRRIVFQFSSTTYFSGWNKPPVKFIPRRVESCLTISLQFVLGLNFGPCSFFYFSKLETYMTKKICLTPFRSCFPQQRTLVQWMKNLIPQQVSLQKSPWDLVQTASGNLFIWEACLFLKYQFYRCSKWQSLHSIPDREACCDSIDQS